MYSEYIYHREEVMKDFIEKEMERQKENAVRAISRCVHFELETITRVLAYSFIEENEDAVKLAHKLNLSKLDFLAIIEDFDGFKEIYLKEQEQNWAQNF